MTKENEISGYIVSKSINITDEMLRAALAVRYPALYRDHLHHPENGPDTARETEIQINEVRKQLQAALAAACPPGHIIIAVQVEPEPMREAPGISETLHGMLIMWNSVCAANGWDPNHMIQAVNAEALIAASKGEA